ncbi:MAG: DUF2917 domain-containing protein [Zoogloeaceae bacterium]|nr:DUF2917 domain-containing protein [Zoogloeaceae bacterium]
MSATLQTSRYTLAHRDLLALEHASGLVVECIDGALWITVENGAGDTVLQAGERMELAAPARIFISALQDARFVARPVSGEVPIRQIATRCAAVLLDRIARWRHPPLASYSPARLR